MKFCKDCKHYEAYKLVYGEVCLSPNLPIDLVTGKPKFALCKDQRYLTWEQIHSEAKKEMTKQNPSYCGIEGYWFEPKVFEPTSIEDADLDDLSKIPFGK
jgi:hypothetical protein